MEDQQAQTCCKHGLCVFITDHATYKENCFV